MANTTNFNWETPDDTDLVKDGALAIRTLGSSIDTSFVDLKGGTTGQVLSKASNTDLDYTWVTTDDANAIQNAIVDAKGDLIAASAADTPARLAVGNNGETLVADSATSTGLRYQVPVNVNPVINSAFQVWQRGTTAVAGTATGAYFADRFTIARGVAGSSATRATTSDTTNLPFIQYCARVQRDSGNSATNAIFLTQSMESVNSISYAGKTVTFSFYARAGANYSAASSALSVQLLTGTGTDQNVAAGFTGSATPINSTATLTTTWQRFTFTGTLASTATQIGFYLSYTPVGTAGANDYFEATGIQIEVGSVATPFKTYAGTLQGELAACQRYYWRFTADTNQTIIAYAFAGSSTLAQSRIQFPVPMRTVPTVLESATLRWTNPSGSTFNMTAVTANETSAFATQIYGTISGATAGQNGGIIGQSTGSYVGMSAEL